MAAGNKTLGQFELADIPPAPRGMPQIEVTFDIDANGIVHVSAKDKATGKEQSIRITAASGLSENEIDKMIKDAELHADEDKEKKELVNAKNTAESLIDQTEKTLKEHSDKIDDATKKSIEQALQALKTVKNENNIEIIKQKSEELTQVSHKLAEAMYQQAAQENPQASDTDQTKASKQDDDVIDADFEEVDSSKK